MMQANACKQIKVMPAMLNLHSSPVISEHSQQITGEDDRDCKSARGSPWRHPELSHTLYMTHDHNYIYGHVIQIFYPRLNFTIYIVTYMHVYSLAHFEGYARGSNTAP